MTVKHRSTAWFLLIKIMNYPPSLDNKIHVTILWFNKIWHIQLMKNVDNTDYIIVTCWWSDAAITVISLGFIHNPDLLYTKPKHFRNVFCSHLHVKKYGKFLLVYLLFLHENLQQSRHCVMHIQLKIKIGRMYHRGLHTEVGWWTKCK
jgi:hypothetical protein